MWLWRRSSREVTTGVPTPTGQPMWLVWLLSIATFIVTVLIVLGLFAAGRWAIHRFSKKATPAGTTTQKQPARSDKSTQNGADKTPPTPPATTPTPPPVSASNPPNNGNTPTTPNTTSPNLINTGPSEGNND